MAMTIDSTRTTKAAMAAPQRAAKPPAPTSLDRSISTIARPDSFLSSVRRSAAAGGVAGAKAGAIMGLFAGMKEGLDGMVVGTIGGGLMGGFFGGVVAAGAAPAGRALSHEHRGKVSAAIGGVSLGAGSLLGFKDGSAVIPGLVVGAYASYAASKTLDR